MFNPEMKVTMFEIADVITTSTGTGTGCAADYGTGGVCPID